MENERKQFKMKGNECKMHGNGWKETNILCYGIDSFVSYDPFTRNWLQGMHIEYSTVLHTHTHLFTCIIASTTSYA